MSIFESLRFGARELRGVTRGTREAVDAGTRVVVVGGGIAGVSAECVLAERGVRVTLLERESHLGGRAGAWTEHLPDGTPFQMERGFNGFFRHYYNLRGLLRRVDPELERLTPLDDYPILGPDGWSESLGGLPTSPPLNLLALLRRTHAVSLRDLRAADAADAQQMLRFDPRKTYERNDHRSAREVLDALSFPERGRQMLYDVFAQSSFYPEDGMSAAEMLMRFHFYFFGNPEGLVFDVLDEPPSDALWRPMERYLQGLGVDVRLGCSLNRAEQVSLGRWRAHTSAQRLDCEGLVLAVEVPALKTLFESSVDLRADPDFDDAIRALEVTSPLAVWRLFLDRPANDERPPFASMSGMGLLDRISLYERFEGESRRWSLRTGGSIVELHGYACPNDDEPAIRAELRQGLDELYPEFRGAEPVHGSWIFTRDSPAFAPGSHAKRPRVVTPFGNVVLAGDFVKLPFPTAQMERAAASGMLAANHLLDRWDVRGESLFSVPGRGFMAPTPVG